MGWNCLAQLSLLHHRYFIVYSFPKLLELGRMNHLPWCAHSYFWQGASYCGRRDQPWSYWMLAAVGFERQIHSHIYYCRPLDGVSIPIWVTGCWLYPLGYTRHDLINQGDRQFCWCRLHLYFSGHVDIVHQENFWYLTDIFHWWRRCMLIDYREGTNFHQLLILLQQIGWYLPHTLRWSFICCVRTLLWFHHW